MLVPSRMTTEQQDGFIGALLLGTLAAFLLPEFEGGMLAHATLSLVCGGMSGYAAMRTDPAGQLARGAGRTANVASVVAYDAALTLDAELRLSEQAKGAVLHGVRGLTERLKQSLKEDRKTLEGR